MYIAAESFAYRLERWFYEFGIRYVGRTASQNYRVLLNPGSDTYSGS